MLTNFGYVDNLLRLKDAYLMSFERSTSLWVEQSVIRGQFNTGPFNRIIAIDCGLRPMTYPQDHDSYLGAKYVFHFKRGP